MSAFQFSNDSLATTPMDAEINIIVHDPTLGPWQHDIRYRSSQHRERESEGFRVCHHDSLIARYSQFTPSRWGWSEWPGQSKVSLSMCRRIPSANDGDRNWNWSLFKKGFVAFSISLLTFSVYIGSAIAIYTMSEIGIIKEFKVKVSQVKATLDLTLYILAYGISPMLLTPLQEMASYGRNPACIIGLAIFVLFNLPIVVPHNFSVILAFRFFTRFIGGPALATRGVSMADIFPGSKLSYAIGICALDAVGGPILSPVIVSPIYTLNLYITDTAQRADSQFKLKAGDGQCTSSFGYKVSHSFSSLSISQRHTRPISNILSKRTRRLRKLTSSLNLRSQSEADEAKMNHKEFIYESLVHPFVLVDEPAVSEFVPQFSLWVSRCVSSPSDQVGFIF